MSAPRRLVTEPVPLTVFDLAHSIVVIALVDSFGFSESGFQFARSGWNASTISCRQPSSPPSCNHPSTFRKPPSMLRSPKRSDELGAAQPGRADAAHIAGLGFPASTLPSRGRLAARKAHS